ncbi:MAG TPA: Txe/YoeB family addiction module toxin [Pedobacter sp.]|uniref:Txe/YoeB family addiction module toxin n=1 Tax=Pedobacter sp. TaxID=1411316 RepID=UPI002B797CDC|nr:Txe/YoeB family addiction module toxin [Pedobacter sp.]HMI01686.1 Txe/YoeB family addiction module toxin [Pedobacter sp.]
MKIIFQSGAWEDYLYWQQTDKSILKKINMIIKEIERTPYEGQGKPEMLKHDLSGWWFRRLNLEHHVVYRIEDDSIIILQCRYHY